MFAPHPAELLVLLVFLAVVLGLAYVVIRLAVRHGSMDAHRRLRAEGSPAPGDDRPARRP